MKNKTTVLLILLLVSITLNGLLGLSLFTEKKPDLHGSYQVKKDGEIYTASFDTDNMTFYIMHGASADGEYMDKGSILSLEGRTAILENDDGQRLSVTIDDKNKLLTYYNASDNLLLELDKKSEALVEFSDHN